MTLDSNCSLFMLPTGHKDSVTCAVFSHDSSLVATADMSGLIKVWKVENKEEIWSFEVGDLEVRECVSVCASVSTCAECSFTAGIYEEIRGCPKRERNFGGNAIAESI